MSDCLFLEEFLSHHQKVEKVRNQFDLIISHEYTKRCDPYFGEMSIEASGLVFACPYNTHVNFGVYKRGMDLSELIYNSDLFNKLIPLSREELNRFSINYFGECGALAKHSTASV
jgi:MoaA/NifB/PqqE/SkfB family radical SAM enzyme